MEVVYSNLKLVDHVSTRPGANKRYSRGLRRRNLPVEKYLYAEPREDPHSKLPHNRIISAQAPREP